MKKFLIGLGVVFLALIVLLVVGGGTAFFKANKMTPAIESFVDGFYEQYNQEQFDLIFNSLADAKYKEAANLDTHRKFLTGVFEKLGKVEKREKGAWKINYMTDGTYYAVDYAVSHTNGKQSTDNFILKMNGDTWLLAGYHVNSPDLFQ